MTTEDERRERAREFRANYPSIYSDITNNVLDYMTRFASEETKLLSARVAELEAENKRLRAVAWFMDDQLVSSTNRVKFIRWLDDGKFERVIERQSTQHPWRVNEDYAPYFARLSDAVSCIIYALAGQKDEREGGE